MKVNQAKKDLLCFFCKLPITKGDICIRDSFKKEDRWVFLFFHEGCYVEKFSRYTQEKVRDFKVKQSHKSSPGKRGRPPKFVDLAKRLEYRNLKDILKYHKKLGHTDKVEELEGKIKELEISLDK